MLRKDVASKAPLHAELRSRSLLALLFTLAAVGAEAVVIHSRTPQVAWDVLASTLVVLFVLYALPAVLVSVVLVSAWALRGRPESSLRVLVTPAKRVVPTALAAIVATAIFMAAVVPSTFEWFARFHAPWLSSIASAAVAWGSALLASFVFFRVRRASTRLAAAVPFLMIPLPYLVALLALGIAAGLWAVRRFPETFIAYPPIHTLWLPSLLVGYWLLSNGFGAWFRRARRGWSTTQWALVVLASVATLAALVVGLPEVKLNRVRGLIGSDTIGGVRLMRVVLNVTDRDRDGFSSVFGGGDCDDGNATIHPGAPDPTGDGVDADCLDGDGARDIVPRGDGRYASVPSSVPERMNVIFLSIDALRPDHLSFFDYERATSPSIDAFLESAIVFERAQATSSRSIRSISSLMTGLYPSEVAFGTELEWTGLLAENQTLAEVLSEHGYQTHAVIGGTYFGRSRGFFQGFDEVEEDETTAERMRDTVGLRGSGRGFVVDRSIAVMERMRTNGQPFFLWSHLMNVHAPYLHDGLPSRFGAEQLDKYDEEIVLADAEVARLLHYLKTSGLEDSTMVVLWSDHGEAFGEHGHDGHSQALYEEEIRMLMSFRVPHLAARRVQERVAMMDGFATTLNLLRTPVPGPVSSESLVAQMLGESRGARTLIAELMPDGNNPLEIKSITRDEKVLMWWLREARTEFYDVARDPRQRRQDDRQAEAAETMLHDLRRFMSTHSRREHDRSVQIAQAVLQRMPEVSFERQELSLLGGELTLVGCNVDGEHATPSGAVAVSCYFRVNRETDHDLRIHIDLRPRDPSIIVPSMGSRHIPVHSYFPTTDWPRGKIVRDDVSIAVVSNIRPGAILDVTLRISEQNRLVVFDDGAGELYLGEIRVAAQPGRRSRISPAGTDAGQAARPGFSERLVPTP